MRPRLMLFAVAAFPLVGCGGANDASSVRGYNDCVSVGGTIYTVDGPVGSDDGYSYPCSDNRSPKPTAAVPGAAVSPALRTP